MMRHVVVGIDPSLTSTGLVAVAGGSVLGLKRVRVKPMGSERSDSHKRMRAIVAEVGEFIASSTAAAAAIRAKVSVGIEGPAFMSRHGSPHERAGLWWLIFDDLHDRGLTPFIVPPNSLKKYATGRGNASKDEVLAAVVRRYSDADVTGNDVADALTIAAMGARHLGDPVEANMPKENQKGLGGVSWVTVDATQAG